MVLVNYKEGALLWALADDAGVDLEIYENYNELFFICSVNV